MFVGGINAFQIKVYAFFDENEIKDNLFIFINKNRKQIKLFYQTSKGTYLTIYRLNKGKFSFPDTNSEGRLDRRELIWLLEGLTKISRQKEK